jgi:hypothetical protein
MTKNKFQTEFRRLLKIRTAAKAGYQEAERIETELLAAAKTARTPFVVDGQQVRVKNNFIGPDGLPRNTAWKSAGVKFEELELAPVKE